MAHSTPNQGGYERIPARDGSDLLIQLYVDGVVTEPDLYLCPASGDTNGTGADIWLGNPACTSYAAHRQATRPLSFGGHGVAETALASDDSEGATAFNHGDACSVLFLSLHVEHIDTDETRLREVTRVGQPGTLLEQLAN